MLFLSLPSFPCLSIFATVSRSRHISSFACLRDLSQSELLRLRKLFRRRKLNQTWKRRVRASKSSRAQRRRFSGRHRSGKNRRQQVSPQTPRKIRRRTAEIRRRPDARYYPYSPSLMRRCDDVDDGTHTWCIMQQSHFRAAQRLRVTRLRLNGTAAVPTMWIPRRDGYGVSHPIIILIH